MESCSRGQPDSTISSFTITVSVLSKSSNSSILNVSSIYGLLGPDWSLYEGTSMSNPAAYAASKGD